MRITNRKGEPQDLREHSRTSSSANQQSKFSFMVKLWNSPTDVAMSRKGGNKPSFITLGISSKKSNEEEDTTRRSSSHLEIMKRKEAFKVRSDSLGYNPHGHHESNVKIESLGYLGEESEVFRAYAASQHYGNRGNYWNDGKREIMLRYLNLTMIGVAQGTVAYFTNFFAKSFIDVSYATYITFCNWTVFLSLG